MAVIGYYSSWAHYRAGLAKYTVEDIPVEQFTHLIYAFATLDSQTLRPKCHDTYLDIDLGNYRKFIQLKRRNPNVKLLLGLGGWNDSRDNSIGYSRLVSDSTLRRTFTSNMVGLLQRHGFDGLDLDWEYPCYDGCQTDRQGFTLLVEDLKRAFRPNNLLLTAAVSANRSVVDRGYDIRSVSQHLDMINLMTYDFYGSNDGRVAHHAPLYSVGGMNPEFCADFIVNHWINNGAPAHKLVLGVPFYGVTWTLAGHQNCEGSAAQGPGLQSKYVQGSATIPYFECCLAHQREGWTKKMGKGGPYLTKGNQWISYDDVDAVTRKARYALQKGLGGVMVWDIVSDDFQNACGLGPNPLLKAINSTLRR